MGTTTRTPAATSTPAEDGPRPAASAADRVLAALRGHPGATTAQLATIAGIGRSTTGKALAALGAVGTVTREPGGRDGARRLPDCWRVAQPPQPKGAAGDRTGSAPADGARRLRSGALREMVAGYLAAHADEAVGPVAVAAALNRSAGAIANALQTLAASGVCVQVSDRPRRYRWSTEHGADRS